MHSHLNRLNKIRSQVTTAGKKILNLDSEWKVFIEQTIQKVRRHALMFQQCRGDILEIYDGKMQELRQTRQEVSMGSQYLLEQKWTAPTLPEARNLADQLAELEGVIDIEGLGDQIDLTEESMEMDEDQAEETTFNATKIKHSPKVPKGFKAAQSPTKVATQRLKTKSNAKDNKEPKRTEVLLSAV